ncbi:hypothetical protein ABPG72_017610 [Tetrahymena utriculariae]
MKNMLLFFLACFVLSIKGTEFSFTIDQVNNKIVKPLENIKCEGFYCFVGDTLFTIQSNSTRINSITLSDSKQSIVIETCPSSNTLTINNQDMLQLFDKINNRCYPFSNNWFTYQKPGKYSVIINAQIQDKKNQQFDLFIDLNNPSSQK